MNNDHGPKPSPGRRLREAWAKEPIQVPGVFNALVARMAERLGYRAVYLSGGALSAATGVPDVGLLTLNDFVDQARTRGPTPSSPRAWRTPARSPASPGRSRRRSWPT